MNHDQLCIIEGVMIRTGIDILGIIRVIYVCEMRELWLILLARVHGMGYTTSVRGVV